MKHTTLVLGALFGALVTAPVAARAETPGGGGPVARGVRNTFRNASLKNGATRVLHRAGDTYEAALHPAPGSPLGTAPTQVLVRLSRGANTPQPKADFLGFAMRVPQAAGGHDDLLMVSSGEGALRRRLPSRAGSFFAKGYSSLLPFRVDGQKYLIRAFPNAQPQAARTGTDLDELRSAAAGGRASFRVELEGLRGAPDRALGEVVLERPLAPAASDALKFDLWQNPTVKPAGFINRLRRWAYQGSQSTR